MNDMFALIFLSTFVEGFVKYVFDVFTGVEDGTPKSSDKIARLKPYTHYVALVLSVAIAFAYRVDIPAMFGLVTNHLYVNYLISGIAIGRGSNYLNDLISKVRKGPNSVSQKVTVNE